MRKRITIKGIVQGVGFRPFVYRLAIRYGLAGFVRNRADATVEIVVEGEEARQTEFIESLKEEKPPLAQIFDFQVEAVTMTDHLSGFEVLASSSEREHVGSTIPPDVSICSNCASELREVDNRRNRYFFITCTDCGPRFTIINSLPYDRPNTTMKEFTMCDKCQAEYSNPFNRRFHAQTVACSACGPQVWLTDRTGSQVEANSPIALAGRLLEEGYVVAVMGNGGFHIATATTQDEPISRIRRTKHRRSKPFAIMARDLKTANSFAEISQRERQILESYVHPIVLLRKTPDYYLSNLVSPGLHTIGTMLPYSGLHMMLFDETREPAFVMTSANPPSEPIIKNQEDALQRLGHDVDYFLIHNREIAQRCDDSVARIVGRREAIVRRSRGYAPSPVHLKKQSRHPSLGVGGELNVTVGVVDRYLCYLSQHIGDIERLETLQFLRETTDHMLHLTGVKPEGVGCDLHPSFQTTRFAQALGETLRCEVSQVQHHYAHAAALMAEHGVSELIAIVCDGYGYGENGEAWGGEILHCYSMGYRRVGHLEKQPLIGGDLAARYPLRMAAGILHKEPGFEEWLHDRGKFFPHGIDEIETILKQASSESGLKTSSCGRILDAAAAILGICYERTYEGEPAMRLESAAMGGEDKLRLSPQTSNGVIETAPLLSLLFALKEKFAVRDLAYSAQAYLARSLSKEACAHAMQLGVRSIGFSGGVAYNDCMTSIIGREVEESGFHFLMHRAIPAGDGGISLGQALVASGS